MAVSEDAPKNTASRFLKIMGLIIFKKLPHIYKLISYQDTRVHTGTIYKASGWTPTNKTKFLSWKNRKDFNRSDQSKADKIRWEKQIRPEPIKIKTCIYKDIPVQSKLW